MSAIRLGRRTGIARYHQVYTLLARALSDGTISPGSALPSEYELMRQYQVSRNTIRNALARLERDKRIVRRRGSGTFARQVGSLAPSGEVIDVPKDLAFGSEGSARILQFGRSPLPGLIRSRWSAFGGETVMFQRLWSLREEPVAVCTVHIELEQGRKLRRNTLGVRSAPELLEAVGSRIGRMHQSCRAQAADAIVAEQLRVLPGAALLVVTRWVTDSEDRPLFHQQFVCRGDLFEFQAAVA